MKTGAVAAVVVVVVEDVLLETTHDGLIE